VFNAVPSARCTSAANVDFSNVDMLQKQWYLLIIFVLSVVLCTHILFIGCLISDLNVSMYISSHIAKFV
jgi:hypothetical protein